MVNSEERSGVGGSGKGLSESIGMVMKIGQIGRAYRVQSMRRLFLSVVARLACRCP